MPRKKNELRVNANAILQYRWKFLRRNPNYIRDCEAWSGLSKKEWCKSEVILGYPFSGKKLLRLGSKYYSKSLWDYYDKHSIEWNNFRESEEKYHALKKIGFNPPTTLRQFSWYSYYNKWKINMPLNPLFEKVPFFITIGNCEIISEHFGFVNSDGETSSVLKVNWTMPKEQIMLLFKDMLEAKQELLESKGKLVAFRVQFAMLDTYLKIIDLKHARKTVKDVALSVYYSGTDTAINRVKENQKVAFRILNGGYLQLGTSKIE